MLLVSGLDLVIIGRYDYAMTAYYAVSVSLTSLVVGTLSSLSNALIPGAARIADEDRSTLLTGLLFRGSRLISGAAIFIAAPLIFAPEVILGWWLGDGYAERASFILSILALAAVLRNTMLPYVTVAIGIGLQRKMLVTPLIEASVTISVSIWLVQLMGAAGVAVAKIVGGVVGVLLMLTQYVLREVLVDVGRMQYMRQCVLRGMLALGAITLGANAFQYLEMNAPGFVKLAVVVAVSATSIWWLGLNTPDRQYAYSLLRQQLRPRDRP